MCMMYNPTDFGKLDSAGNRLTTIEPLKPGVKLGQVEAKSDLSLLDKIELGRAYQNITAVSCFKLETLKAYAAYLMPELELQCPEGGGGGVFNVGDIADITEECTENCAHLYFYDKDGNQITVIGGTARNFRDSPDERHRRGIKNVASVQQSGFGCHKIFSRSNYRSTAKEIIGTQKINLAEEGFTKTKIMSVKYKRDCKFPARA